MRRFLFALGLAVGFAASPLASATARVENAGSDSAGCCRICSTGKACGNSCISRRYTCHQPPGCACDG